MNQYHKIMEKFWLLMAIVSFVYAVYMFGKRGLEDSMIYFLFPLVAAGLYYMRYFMRKKFEQRSGDE
jgi:hypothetical protein